MPTRFRVVPDVTMPNASASALKTFAVENSQPAVSNVNLRRRQGQSIQFGSARFPLPHAEVKHAAIKYSQRI
jgi:hypothetical protein